MRRFESFEGIVGRWGIGRPGFGLREIYKMVAP